MAWGRLDDQANSNPKLLVLTNAAWRMWGCAIIYAQGQLTDGFIPREALPTFGVRMKKGASLEAVANELCRRLVRGKGPLWHKVRGGYQINDYLDWNDSRAEILNKRAKDRHRKSGGVAQDSARIPNGTPSGIQNVSTGPTPTPTPTPLTKIKSTGAARQPVENPVENSDGTFRLYCVIADEARQISIREDRSDDLGNIAAVFKTLCAQRHLNYDSDIAARAIDAVLRKVSA